MTAPIPAGSIGHGSPMNVLNHNQYTDAWSAFGDAVKHQRAVLVVSAHWYANATAVTATFVGLAAATCTPSPPRPPPLP